MARHHVVSFLSTIKLSSFMVACHALRVVMPNDLCLVGQTIMQAMIRGPNTSLCILMFKKVSYFNCHPNKDYADQVWPLVASLPWSLEPDTPPGWKSALLPARLQEFMEKYNGIASIASDPKDHVRKNMCLNRFLRGSLCKMKALTLVYKSMQASQSKFTSHQK